jgi:hypothetical protein
MDIDSTMLADASPVVLHPHLVTDMTEEHLIPTGVQNLRLTRQRRQHLLSHLGLDDLFLTPLVCKICSYTYTHTHPTHAHPTHTHYTRTNSPTTTLRTKDHILIEITGIIYKTP